MPFGRFKKKILRERGPCGEYICRLKITETLKDAFHVIDRMVYIYFPFISRLLLDGPICDLDIGNLLYIAWQGGSTFDPEVPGVFEALLYLGQETPG